MKKILIIADALDKFNINGDTTHLLMLTAKDLGYELNFCLSSAIYALNDKAYGKVSKLTVKYGIGQIYSSKDWFKLAETARVELLADFDAVFVRNDPPFNMEYYYLTQILELAEKAGAKIINNSLALRNYNEKLAILNFPELIVATLVSKNKEVLKEFIVSHDACVAKPIDMMAGRGVFQISKADPNLNVILETLSDYYRQTIMVQKFIPEVIEGDKRIFIVNGQVIDYCLYRIPEKGQIRGNLAAGGRGEVHKLNSYDYEIAHKVAKWLSEHKIAFAGIDVIGKYLTEINITSPTGAHQVLRDAGVNVMEILLNMV